MIDADKITKILGVSWRHFEFDESVQDSHHMAENVNDSGSYIFDFPNGTELSFHKIAPKNIVVREPSGNIIYFDNVTEAYYFESPQVFVAESVGDSSFSEMRVFADGDVVIKINRLIEEYKDSFSKIYEQGIKK